mmetsp:Transcript_25700/g.31659  ORF Transcript_25700/g.31659 Transcript_25700/m.31659 type:complete len:1036 (+) Transcript_25700:141-3248(+)
MTENSHDTKPRKKGGGSSNSGGGFQSMGLSEPVYGGIVKMGFRVPTPVQRKSLPVILSGNDTVVMARTGSGKTAAFCIPLLERYLNSQRRKQQQSSASSSSTSNISGTSSMSAAAVILSPTRELSLQTLRVLKTMSMYVSEPKLNCIGINGGESMEKQFSLLSSQPDVIAATPGRLAHHLSEIPDFHLKHCDLVIFDEADRLFEMGFAMQIRQICNAMPGTEAGRQTLLFSATMPKVLIEFTRCGIMDSDPNVVRLDKDATVSDELRIGFICVRSQEKDAALIHLLRDVLPKKEIVESDKQTHSNKKQQSEKQKQQQNVLDVVKGEKTKLGLTLIFAATRHHVDYLTTLVNNSCIGDQNVATCIYGTMDQEARKENLYSFRSGKSPIMFVTDVAARGIDVPLIDNVIHYSFPPSAKLFVHRSGRAARAGRIGYCWGLVDSEEMGYMVDLHLFLGRKLSTSQEPSDDDNNNDNNDEALISNTDKVEKLYSIAEMTPEMVHYGSVPESIMTEEVENVRRIVESELTASHDAEMLRMLIRVCNNAMKQYRRTRPEASRQGIKRAKAILEGEKQKSGKRKGGGRIPTHPILRKVELDRMMAAHANGRGRGRGQGQNTNKNNTEQEFNTKMKELKQREEFLKAMSTFRPKETIFESFATGGGKSAGVVSHLDKGCTTGMTSNKKNSNNAFEAMKSMRRQMKLVNNKAEVLVVAGSDAAMIRNGENGESIEQDTVTDEDGTINLNDSKSVTLVQEKSVVITEKKRLSKAERKRQKKQQASSTTAPSLNTGIIDKKAKNKRGTDFRDQSFYIDNEITEDSAETHRDRHIEAAMQPSSSNTNDGIASAFRLEQTMIDIVGDENADLVKNHRITRWDKSKRKYVQTTIGAEVSGDSKSKKIRLESGRFIKSDKAKLGELYEKWQKKTNKSIGRVGVFDDVTTNDQDNDIEHVNKGKNASSKKNKGNVAENELKSATQIRKKRKADEKMKLKNMKKSERSQVELKKRAQHNARAAEFASQGAGWQGKKGFSGRYGQPTKGKPNKR